MKVLLSKLSILARLLREEKGQDLVEYALLVALVAFAITAGVNKLAKKVNRSYSTVGTSLTTAIGQGSGGGKGGGKG